MSLTDKFGRPWALYAAVKEGDTLAMGSCFTCLRMGDRRTVLRIKDVLCIECDAGVHFLCGQVGDDGELVGMYPVTEE